MDVYISWQIQVAHRGILITLSRCLGIMPFLARRCIDFIVGWSKRWCQCKKQRCHGLIVSVELFQISSNSSLVRHRCNSAGSTSVMILGTTSGRGAVKGESSFAGTVISSEDPRTRIVYMKTWNVLSEFRETILQNLVPLWEFHFAVLPFGRTSV